MIVRTTKDVQFETDNIVISEESIVLMLGDHVKKIKLIDVQCIMVSSELHKKFVFIEGS